MPYNHKELETKWQKYWSNNKTFKTENDFSRPKFYSLDMFPYPSGAGLHVGHPKGFVGNDIFTRYKHAKGFNVLHPMGWDAFGLPAENYAIKTGTHPRITTDTNIENYKRQLQILGLGYDWDREIDTTDPEYYKWTQWIFTKLFEHGLAYEQDLPINYCPSCKTGLANEEVLSDNTCDRCGTLVEKRALRQWVLAITKYAERLITDVDELDWAEGIKEMQRNWIGKSEGCEFEMRKSDDANKFISVYTTRIDTVFGMTYAVMAPDHPRVYDFVSDEQSAFCEAYITEAASRSDQDRTNEGKEKTGVWTGSYVINPFNGQAVPLWIGDYVLGHYGTGAVMAVPAHDERDFAFAKRYDLPIIPTIYPENIIKKYREQADAQYFSGLTQDQANEHIKETQTLEDAFFDALPFTVDGYIGNINFPNTSSEDMEKSQKIFSDIFGLHSAEARKILSEKAEIEGFGHKKVNYKLRDWLFSRQRYWGEPIPLIHLALEDLKRLPHITDISEATDMGLAYILKRDALPGEKTDGVSCKCGHIRELIIGGKVFSKIYDGINSKIIIDSNLPLILPQVEKYEPAGDGQSPLATVPDWVNVTLASNLSGKRETNTMPQWGGSCWYYLRYMDPKNSESLVANDVVKYWGEVDNYVGGAEHAVLHLLYARFWHKFLYDIGVVPTKEPFHRLRNQGMILAYAFERDNGGLVAVDLVEERDDGKFYEISTGKEVKRIISKMSKSLKNVVNPDDIVEEHGADSLRMYEMAISDFKDAAPWDTKGLIGIRRFLDKTYMTFEKSDRFASDDMKVMKLLHKTIKKVGEDIEAYKFNTAISALQILLNEGLPKDSEFQKEWKETFTILLHPFAPHMAEELWESMGHTQSVYFAEWLEYDEFMLVDDEVTIAVQVNGKLRGTLTCMNGVAQDEVSALAHESPDIAKWIQGKILVKEIYIPNKMLSIVVKDA